MNQRTSDKEERQPPLADAECCYGGPLKEQCVRKCVHAQGRTWALVQEAIAARSSTGTPSLPTQPCIPMMNAVIAGGGFGLSPAQDERVWKMMVAAAPSLPSATDAPEREGFYEKLWKDFCSLQRGDVQQIAKNAERYRWLLKYEWDLIILPKFVGHPEKDGHEYASSPAELEAAIDVAISDGGSHDL